MGMHLMGMHLKGCSWRSFRGAKSSAKGVTAGAMIS